MLKTERYRELNCPIRIRLTQDNREMIDKIQDEFRLRSLNQTVNFCIAQVRNFIEFKNELKVKGSFVLNQETARRFGISLYGGEYDTSPSVRTQKE